MQYEALLPDEPSDQQQPLVCPLSDKELIDLVLDFTCIATDGMRGGEDLYLYQKLFVRRIIEASIRREKAVVITALFARQSGKTEAVAAVSYGMAVIVPVLAMHFPDDNRLKRFKPGFLVGIFAPKKDQSLISYKRIRKQAVSVEGAKLMADPDINIDLIADRADHATFSTGSEIHAQTASPDAEVEGHTYHLVICDEAHKLQRSKVEHDITPMLTATNGVMVKIGTAWESRGGFMDDIKDNENILRGTGVRNHFEFDYKQVIKEKRAAYKRTGNDYHLNYPDYVTGLIAKQGGIKNVNEEFRMNYMLDWGNSRVIAFTSESIALARDFTNTLNLPRAAPLMVAGLDVAKSNDSTVCTVYEVDISHPAVDTRASVSAQATAAHASDNSAGEEDEVYYNKTLVGLLELQGDFEGDEGQYQRVVGFLNGFNVRTLICDATSMGDPVFERLRVLLGRRMDVEPYRYSTQSKSYLYKYYLQEWKAGRVRFAATPRQDNRDDRLLLEAFEGQHKDLDKTYSGNYLVCEASNGHDDFCDSSAMAVWAERVHKQNQMPTVVQTEGAFTSKFAQAMMHGGVSGAGHGPSILNPIDAIQQARAVYGREYKYQLYQRGGRRR